MLFSHALLLFYPDMLEKRRNGSSEVDGSRYWITMPASSDIFTIQLQFTKLFPIP